VNGAIQIRRAIFSEAVSRARGTPKQECCGLLAGREDVITHIFPAVNALASPTAYEIAPRELFRLMREIRVAGVELMGIYHSHPNERNEPSPSDIERAYYPDVAHFILSPQADAAQPVRAFFIRDGKVEELEVQII
jgi:[CysO sulfur-carrier protein]-S-L-cysteine hydrolase